MTLADELMRSIPRPTLKGRVVSHDDAIPVLNVTPGMKSFADWVEARKGTFTTYDVVDDLKWSRKQVGDHVRRYKKRGLLEVVGERHTGRMPLQVYRYKPAGKPKKYFGA